MKAVLSSSRMLLRQVSSDSMLAVICLVPILTAILFRYGVPEVEHFLTNQFNRTAVLEPYYTLFDLILALLTPYMFCFASSMIMLGEQDDRISSFLVVTPMGKMGYFFSRLLLPALLSSFLSYTLVTLCSLTGLSWPMIASLSILSALQSCIISMIVVSFAHNKVEGLALAKLSGLMMLGLPFPFFMNSGIEYVFFPLPSFWMSKLAIEHQYVYLIPTLTVTSVWMLLLLKRFVRRFEL